MKRWLHPLLVLVVLAGTSSGAETEKKAPYSRRTPIVEAVQKTRASIVCIRADRPGHARKDCNGTGLIVDERGYILTNRHVIAGASYVAVRLADGTQLPAQVYIEDASHDLAILYARASKKLPALRLGPARDLMVGETVIAVGHPYGYTFTVSTGIISALGREITLPSGHTLAGLIQTNADINPGNSGGPLLNINGEVIGVTTAMRDGAQGIAFALNADMVQQVLSRHLSAARMSGLRHGLQVEEEVIAESGDRVRVRVQGVETSSPAAGAGLKEGDTIVEVADLAVANRFDIERALWDVQPGDPIKVTVVRGGEQVEVALNLTPGHGDDTRTVVTRSHGGPRYQARPVGSR